MTQLTLTLLGGFAASLDGKPLSGIKTDKARALLIYLAVERSRPHRRQALAGMLWPDYPEEGARANLRHALANLRQVLEEDHNNPPFLLIEGETLQINPQSACWVDVAEFERLAASSILTELESSAALYRGGFLEGFSLKDSPDFDSWTAILRERYLQLASKTLGKLGEQAAQDGEYEPAISYARRRLALEPWQEDAHHQLMRFLALNGQRASALAQYEACQKILKEELGVEPSIETRRLQFSIRLGEIPEAKREKVHLHNLPSQVTSFIGRQKDVEDINALFGRGARRAPSQTRLVTLTGSGGTGKTRLSLQIANELLDGFPDGVWLVELGSLADPELVVQTTARTLGMRLEAGAQALTDLEDYLEEKHLLLILDNCEHLVEACACLADALLKACPHLHILVSSREGLGIEGETSYRVPPLTLPDPQNLPPLDDLEDYEAIRLFLERAAAASPGFHLTPENASAIAQICQCLDGIPLALELAAALVKVLQVQEIALRLDDRLRPLTGGSRAALPRHQTLRASIDWSYDLLPPPERTLLQRLSVFASGWVLEAAEYVGGQVISLLPLHEGREGGGPGVGEVPNLLFQLVNKSLVTVDSEIGPETRYRMLETIRQYAHEKLVESGENESTRDRHLMYYVELAERFASKIRGPDMAVILSRLEAELDNLRLALGWSMEDQFNPSHGSTSFQMIEHALRLATALLWFWHLRGRSEEGLQWLERLLAAQQEESAEQDFDSARTQHRAEALLVAGWVATQVGENPKAVELFEESRILFQRLGQEGTGGIARIHFYLGAVTYYRGNLLQSKKFIEESLAIFQERVDRFWESESLGFLGAIALYQREYDRARIYFEQDLAFKKQLGDQDGIADMLYMLGVVAFYEQFQIVDPILDNQTTALFEESLKFFSKINSASFCKPSNRLGYIKWRQGNYSKAAEYFKKVLSYSRKIDSFGIVQSLSNLGFLALSQGDCERAAEMFDESMAFSLKRDHKDLIAWSKNNLGALALEKEAFELADRKYKEALSIRQDIDEQFLNADSLIGSSKVLIIRKNYFLVRKYLEEALTINQRSTDPQQLMNLFCILESDAFLEAAQYHLERASRLFGATDAWHTKWQLTRTPRERQERENVIVTVRQSLGDEAFTTAWEEGKAMTLEQAADFARAYLNEK